MKQETENQKPLYKVLDETRPKGNWTLTDNCLWCNEHKVNYIHADTDFSRAEDLANAHYTALAVNNLAQIAEALNNLLISIDAHIAQAECVESFKETHVYKRAKEALTKIT